MRFFNLTPVRSRTLFGLVLAAAAVAVATTVAFAAPAAGHSRATPNAAAAVAPTIAAGTATLATGADTSTAANGQAAGHGAAVEAAVISCKAALGPGQHGIGACVSAVANRHGKAVSGAAKAREHPAK